MKITDYFKSINFCGQLSDPVHNEYFIDILRLCKMKNVNGVIHNASSLKSKEWYIEAFQAHPDMRWVFGIDGLPKDSCLYRINQDGRQVWEVMKMGAEMGCKIKWQYIVFKYNENDIETAREMAKKHNIIIQVQKSSRFFSEDDLKPTNRDYYIERKEYDQNISKM